MDPSHPERVTYGNQFTAWSSVLQLENTPADFQEQAIGSHEPWGARELRRLGGLVLLALAMLHGYEVFRRLDFRDFDDLVRTLLARTWAAQPYYMLGDGYWLTLPAIVRGAWLRLFPDAVMQHPALTVTLMRLVTVGYLWGIWRLLAGAVRMLGGGRTATMLFTVFFIFNGGTFHFAASNYSEPDALFWTLAALVAVMGGLERGWFSARRVLVYGVAMAAACQTRYEAWPLAVVFGGIMLWQSRAGLGKAKVADSAGSDTPWTEALPRAGVRPGGPVLLPQARTACLWAGLLLPALPMLAWIALSAVRQGHPFNFLLLQKKYVGVYRPDDPLLALVKCFLRIHPLWLPVAGVAGVVELARQRRRPVAQCYFIITALLLAWAVFRLWTYVMTHRYAWDAALMLGAAGAVGLERWFNSWDAGRAGDAWNEIGWRRRWIARYGVQGFALLCAIVFCWMTLRQQPYIAPTLRDFAASVQRQTGDGKILFDDRIASGEEYALYTFRVSVVTERLVLASWLARDGRIPPRALANGQVRYVLGKTDGYGLAAGPPLFTDPVTGWKLWRCRRGHDTP